MYCKQFIVKIITLYTVRIWKTHLPQFIIGCRCLNLTITSPYFHLRYIYIQGSFELFPTYQLTVIRMYLGKIPGSLSSCIAMVTRLCSPPEIPRIILLPILESATSFKPISKITCATFVEI